MCGETKPLGEGFYQVGVKDRKYYRYDCKKCWHGVVTRTRQRRFADDPEARAKDNERKRSLQRARKYGFTVAELQAKLVAQGSQCTICGEELIRFHVDHNHTTEQVRDLLCGPCNTGIGLLREDEEIMKSAIRYLRKWNK